jgi:heme exporter protein D
MAARPLFRLFLIAGLIVLAGILGGFMGTYPLFKAIDPYGSWLYVWLGAAFVATVIVLCINDSRKEKRSKQLLALIRQSKQIIQKWKHIGKTLAATKM